MKRFTLIVCFILLALLLIPAVPVAATTTTTASGDVITSISPHVAYANGKTATYTITGNNFTTVSSGGEVWLEMSGENDIPATITSWSPSTIVCTMKISSGRARGSWNLVVHKTYVNGSVTDTNYIAKTSAFTVIDPITLTSIDPATGKLDDDNVAFTIVGTGLSDIEDVYLHNSDYKKNLTGDIASNTDTKIKGSFDLTDGEEDTYEVCVEDTNNIIDCDLSYEVTTNKFGKLDISSSPSGATIYLDNLANGTTPVILKNIPIGSHKIVLKMNGYQDWGKTVTIKDGETSEIDATLYAQATATPATPYPTAAATSQPTAARTTVRSTIKVPTTWADTPATTAASPVEPAFIIGAIGLAFIALRKP